MKIEISYLKFFRRVAALLPALVFASMICMAADVKPSATTATTSGAATSGAKPAPAATKGQSKEDEVVEMSPFIVTATTRGIIPIAAFVRQPLFSRTITSPALIGKSDHPAHLAALEKYGLTSGDCVISIDGEKIQGMTLPRLNALWCEGDPGRPVTLVVQGSGEKESVFRKIVVTTLSLARLRKIEDEWRQQHPDEKIEPPDDSDWTWKRR